MLTNDQMVIAMSAARDQILALMRDHEHKTHDGKPCWGNRASAIAYLSHCLGIGTQPPTLFRAVWDLLQEYDRECKSDLCPHLKEEQR